MREVLVINDSFKCPSFDQCQCGEEGKRPNYMNPNLHHFFSNIQSMQKIIHFSLPKCANQFVKRLWTMNHSFNVVPQDEKEALLSNMSYMFVSDCLKGPELQNLERIMQFIKSSQKPITPSALGVLKHFNIEL